MQNIKNLLSIRNIFKSQKAMHIIEYGVLLAVVIGAVLAMKPSVEKYWKARMKFYDDAISQSYYDPLSPGSFQQSDDCNCSEWYELSVCGFQDQGCENNSFVAETECSPAINCSDYNSPESCAGAGCGCSWNPTTSQCSGSPSCSGETANECAGNGSGCCSFWESQWEAPAGSNCCGPTEAYRYRLCFPLGCEENTSECVASDNCCIQEPGPCSNECDDPGVDCELNCGPGQQEVYETCGDAVNATPTCIDNPIECLNQCEASIDTDGAYAETYYTVCNNNEPNEDGTPYTWVDECGDEACTIACIQDNNPDTVDLIFDPDSPTICACPPGYPAPYTAVQNPDGTYGCECLPDESPGWCETSSSLNPICSGATESQCYNWTHPGCTWESDSQTCVPSFNTSCSSISSSSCTNEPGCFVNSNNICQSITPSGTCGTYESEADCAEGPDCEWIPNSEYTGDVCHEEPPANCYWTGTEWDCDNENEEIEVNCRDTSVEDCLANGCIITYPWALQWVGDGFSSAAICWQGVIGSSPPLGCMNYDECPCVNASGNCIPNPNVCADVNQYPECIETPSENPVGCHGIGDDTDLCTSFSSCVAKIIINNDCEISHHSCQNAYNINTSPESTSCDCYIDGVCNIVYNETCGNNPCK